METLSHLLALLCISKLIQSVDNMIPALAIAYVYGESLAGTKILQLGINL